MEDELVSFETAKLAKEKGFNEICIDSFNSEGEEQNRYNITTIENMSVKQVKAAFETTNSNLEAIANLQNTKPYIARPTQSLLQRWLREKHNIHIKITTDWTLEKLGYCFEYESDIKDSKCLSERYNTYEQALKIGLQESLQLIK